MKWREHTKEFLVGIQSFLFILPIHAVFRFLESSSVLLPWWVITAGILKKQSPLSLSARAEHPIMKHVTTIALQSALKYGSFRYITWNLIPAHTIYSQCILIELKLERTLVKLCRQTNFNTPVEWLNTRVSIECMRKIGTHSRFGAREHEVGNELYHMCKVCSPTSVMVLYLQYLVFRHYNINLL